MEPTHELPSCPFCGSAPSLVYWDNNNEDSCRYQCSVCGCSLWWENTEHEAREEWNKRNYQAEHDALAEQVAKLQEDQRKCPACDGKLDDIDLPVRLRDLLDSDQWRTEWACPYCATSLLIEREISYKIKALLTPAQPGKE